MKRYLIIAIIVCICFAGVSFAKNNNGEGVDYKAGEVLVQFKNVGAGSQIRKYIRGPVSNRAVKNIIASSLVVGAEVKDDLDKVKEGLSLVKLPKGKKVSEAMAEFALSSEIIHIQPNFIYHLAVTTPDDTRFSEQWALDNTGQSGGAIDADIDAPEAWDISTGSDTVIVAVLDTGIDVNHPDLIDNLWADSNDPNLHGYDFAGADVNNADDADSDPMDILGHGTHCAGIIGAVGDNGIGILGVNWDVSLMAIRVFADNHPDNGLLTETGSIAFTTDLVNGIQFAIDNGANIINASLTSGEYDTLLFEAIRAAGDAGVLFVAAAGNDSSDNDGDPVYPANYGLPNIISVMATDDEDMPSVFDNSVPDSATNYGATTVDIAAPGGSVIHGDYKGILSTVPVALGYYDFYQGTSMAAPHVSGAAALMLAVAPNLTPVELKAIIMHPLICDILPTLEGLNVSGGRLNLYKSVLAAESLSATGRVKNFTTNTAYDTIQEAIDDADDDDVIVAQKDNYYFEQINFDSNNVIVRSGDFNNTTVLADILADANDYSATTVISIAFAGLTGTVDEDLAVVTFENGETNGAGLKGFTVTDGTSGGIYIDGAAPTIEDCIITSNDTSSDGAGVYAVDSTGAIFEGCTISDNTGADYGGGIYLENSTVDINDCTISGNSVRLDGGGIYIDETSQPTITNTTISTNTASWSGGGIYCLSSDTVMSALTLTANQASWDGGGIYLDGVNPDINDCTFSNNYARFWGGAINYYKVSDANLIDCSFNNNWVEETAGAVYLDESPINLKNCLFYSNNARTYDAGAIFCWDSSADITNCTFANNTSNTQYGYGGAIAVEGNSDPVILNSIFSGSNRYAIYEFDATSDPNINYCLFYNNSPADFYDKDTRLAYDANSSSANADMNDLAEVGNILYGDPKFVVGKLGNYYLAVNDPNLQAWTARDGNSPAIDAGSGTVAALGLDTYHTRTDNVDDTGTVDIGYHYNDPDVAADYILTIEVLPIPAQSPTVTTDPNATPANGITRKQYAEVILTVTPKTGYVLTSWDGTDDDNIENVGYNDITKKYVNITTMTANKTITLTFSTAEIQLHFVLHDPSEAYAEMTPNTSRRRYTALRGTKVPLYVEPENPSHVVIWYNTDDDDLITRENTITLLDEDGDGIEDVEVEIYSPTTFPVGLNPNYYSLGDALDLSQNRDILVLDAGSYRLDVAVSGIVRKNITKAITIKSTSPTDPNVVAKTILTSGLEISNVGRNMRIEGITISGVGNSTSDGCSGSDTTNCSTAPNGGKAGDIFGGGIGLNNASPTFKYVVFENCSVSGGNGGPGACPSGNGGWGGAAGGGAISIDTNGRPLFENCIFRNNNSRPGNGGDGCTTSPGGDGGSFFGILPYTSYAGVGGAVFCGEGSTPEFVDCNFIGNRIYGNQSGLGVGVGTHYMNPRFGGAVYITTDSKPTFTRCHFEDNIADNNSPADATKLTPYSSYGGAVAMEDGAAPLFVDCNFVENNADIGGAIQWNFADPCLDDSDFVQNVALIGGAVVGTDGAGIITRCNFRLNEAIGINARGGAIGLFGANTAIRDSQFIQNSTTGSGGGIFVGNKDVDGVDFTGVCQVQLKNNLIVSNSAARDGGGIAAADHSEPNIINCTIANNYVTGQDQSIAFGGGVSAYEGAYVRIINSIIWFNTAEYGKQLGVKSWIDRRSTAKVNYSNIQSGAAGVYVSSYSKLDWDYTTNFDGVAPYDSPLFVEGYYLSQDPCQTETSPCVDAGSGTAFDLGFYRHTTNTFGTIDGYDDVNDFGDLGYHYLVQKSLDSDFDYDGDVDIMDYLLMTVNHWLSGDCGYPDWCNEVDLNSDGNINMLDQAIFSAMFGSADPNYTAEANDITPPMPDPMTWLVAPDANGTDEITMTASIAADNSGLPVEYLFQMFDTNGVELTGADANSSWISENEFTQDGLFSNMVYRFAVKARDAKGNETDWSAIGAATTESDGSSSADRNPPQPNPMTWQISPYVIEPNAPGSISMTATNAFDQEGSDVEYNFVCTSHSGQTSGWQSSRVYTLNSVNAGTYSFYVIARDTSTNHNQTTASSTVSVTITGAVVELVVPSISGRASGSGYNISHLITVSNADISGLVEYRFVCVTNSGLSSGWIRPGVTPYTFSKLVGTTSGLLWKVQARLVNDPSQIVESEVILIKL